VTISTREGSVARGENWLIALKYGSGALYPLIANPNEALRENLRSQPAPMPEGLDDWHARQRLEMTARFAQPNASYLHAADQEFSTHQVIERDAAGHNIPPRRSRSESHSVLALRGFDGFGLDECQFEIRFRFEESALLQEIAVPGQAQTGNGLNLINCQRWRLRRRAMWIDSTALLHMEVLLSVQRGQVNEARLLSEPSLFPDE
jgi:hypothetical protein